MLYHPLYPYCKSSTFLRQESFINHVQGEIFRFLKLQIIYILEYEEMLILLIWRFESSVNEWNNFGAVDFVSREKKKAEKRDAVYR